MMVIIERSVLKKKAVQVTYEEESACFWLSAEPSALKC
jgi:hypothetical protein